MSGDHVFGLHAVEAVLRRSPGRVRRLWVQQGRGDARLQAVLDLAAAAGIVVVPASRSELDERESGRHQGVIADLAPARSWREEDLPALLAAAPAPLLLVLDGVTDPHNLGACLRTADAAGAHAVIAPRDNAAGLTPVARKVASGAAESIPFVQVTNLARCLRGLRAAGVWLVGAAGEAEQSLYQIDLRGPVALVMGAEGRGLRRLTREHCDYLAHLPMSGTVSSLNVSVATGVCLFEAVRQRLAGAPT